MYCTNCGAELPLDAEFCVECGTRDEGAVAGATEPVRSRAGKAKWMAFAAVAVLAAVVAGAYLYANQVAKQRVDEVIAELDGKVGLAYGDVSANPFTRSVTIKDVKVTSIAGKPIDGVSMESLSLKGKPDKDADPQELDARVNKLTLDLARMGPQWAQLLTMGYGTVVIDSRLDYRYSRKAGEFDLNRLEIAGQDLLAVSVSLHLGDIGADIESPAQALSRPTTTIRGGELMIKDAVFIERLVNSLAAKDGVDPAAYKKQLTDTVTAVLGGGSSKLDKDLPAAIVGLINEPRSSLRFTIAPKDPVSLAQIKGAHDPARQIELLNLQVGR